MAYEGWKLLSADTKSVPANNTQHPAFGDHQIAAQSKIIVRLSLSMIDQIISHYRVISRLGSGLSFVAQSGAASNIWIQKLAGGAPEQKTHFTSDFIVAYAWSPDGKKIILTRTHIPRDVVVLTDTTKAE